MRPSRLEDHEALAIRARELFPFLAELRLALGISVAAMDDFILVGILRRAESVALIEDAIGKVEVAGDDLFFSDPMEAAHYV